MPALKRALISAGIAAMFACSAYAADSPMTPMAAPAEPNAIPLNTGGVEGQTAKETWYKQWGDPFVRNVYSAEHSQLIEKKVKVISELLRILDFVVFIKGNSGSWLSRMLELFLQFFAINTVMEHFECGSKCKDN